MKVELKKAAPKDGPKADSHISHQKTKIRKKKHQENPLTDDASFSLSQLRAQRDVVFKKNLPLFFLKDESTKRYFLPKKVLPDFFECEWAREEGREPLLKEIELARIKFYMEKPNSKKAVDLGSWSQFREKGMDRILAVYMAMNVHSALDDDRSIVDVATLFHAGLWVPKDQKYARSIIETIENYGLRSLALNEQLVHSVIDERYLPLSVSLLSLGADPNGCDQDGHLPLTYAIFKGNFKAADLLIRHGASKTEMDPALGETARQLLEESESEEKSPIGQTQMKMPTCSFSNTQ